MACEQFSYKTLAGKIDKSTNFSKTNISAIIKFRKPPSLPIPNTYKETILFSFLPPQQAFWDVENSME